jgi:hypothetical protein
LVLEDGHRFRLAGITPPDSENDGASDIASAALALGLDGVAPAAGDAWRVYCSPRFLQHSGGDVRRVPVSLNELLVVTGSVVPGALDGLTDREIRRLEAAAMVARFYGWGSAYRSEPRVVVHGFFPPHSDYYACTPGWGLASGADYFLACLDEAAGLALPTQACEHAREVVTEAGKP